MKTSYAPSNNNFAFIIAKELLAKTDGNIVFSPVGLCRMLEMLSGRKHEVITGFCMISSKRSFCTSSVAEVTFAQMSQQEIADYAASGECDDKAGAYAIQGIGGRFITHIDGDYYSIMGLPVHLVYEELKNASLY